MNTPSPMLAHVLEDKPLQYPVFMQPKLDGVRCLTYLEEGALTCMSRNGKPLHIPPCIHALPDKVLQKLADGLVLDGELYIHGKGFQTVVSIVKRRDHPLNNTLEYHIYDCFYFDAESNEYGSHTNEDRINILDELQEYNGLNDGVEIVHTTAVDSANEQDIQHAEFVSQGYEGSIIRNMNAPYLPKRSHALLKRKDFKDAEYHVVDILEGSGKNAGTAVLVCSSNGATFTATAPGNYADKANIWQTRAEYIGRNVTIKYQELSDDGIPRFPVALGFPEDR